MGQDEFALVVDVKTKPGSEQEYESLMLDVVERQTAEATYIGTSVHRDPNDTTHSRSMRPGAIAGISRRSK
jgi:quinol monooxygenase YgiN